MPVSFEEVTKDQLEARLKTALGRAGLTYEELSELARRYMLTPEELDVWDEVRRIQFLLDG